MDAGWIVEGSDEVIGIDQLRALSQSGGLAGRSVRSVGASQDLAPEELSALVGLIAPPVTQVNTPPVMASYPRPTGGPVPQDDAMKYVMPTNPSFWALASGYLGLGSALCIPGPFAIITGILGLIDIKKNPHRDGKFRAWFGIVMGSIGTVTMIVFAIISLIQK